VQELLGKKKPIPLAALTFSLVVNACHVSLCKISKGKFILLEKIIVCKLQDPQEYQPLALGLKLSKIWFCKKTVLSGFNILLIELYKTEFSVGCSPLLVPANANPP
jgi:hypothetical protein